MPNELKIQKDKQYQIILDGEMYTILMSKLLNNEDTKKIGTLVFLNTKESK